jgi:hypothetical protein
MKVMIALAHSVYFVRKCFHYAVKETEWRGSLARKWLGLLIRLIAACFAITIILNYLFGPRFELTHYVGQLTLVLILLLMPSGLWLLVSFTVWGNVPIPAEVKPSPAPQSPPQKDESVNVIMTRSLVQLHEYHAINKRHARQAFAFAVIASTFGFVVIIIGVLLAYGQQVQQSYTNLAAAGGILMEFIGGTAFFIYRSTQNQTTHFYNRLMDCQQMMLALENCQHMQDPVRRDMLREQLLTQILVSTKSQSFSSVNAAASAATAR